MRRFSAIVARAGERLGIDTRLALLLTAVGELEVLLGPGGGGSRLVSALSLPLATLALAWRRDVPWIAPPAVALALLVQAALDGFLIGHSVTVLVAVLLALYSAGRYVDGARGLAVCAVSVVAIVATRNAVDPEVQRLVDGLLTLLVVPVPLLVGRWVRGQVFLQRELQETAERLTGERERNARRSAEEERMRIATDLEAAVSDGLSVIVHQAREVPGRLGSEDCAGARELLASIAGNARAALADVRRILGVLRRDGQAPLAPPLDGAEPGRGPAAQADRESEASRGGVDGVAAPPARSPWLPALAGRDAHRLDRVLVAILLVGAEIELAIVAPSGSRLIAALTAVAIVTPLLLRRRRPLAAAVAMLVALSIQSAVLSLDGFPLSDIVTMTCVSYAIGAHGARRAALTGLGLVALGAGAHAATFYPDGVAPALLGGVAVPWILGRIVRGQRQLTRERRQDATRIELAHAREARAAVIAERMRVARELHDAVAHNISVIAIQAAGADGIVERDPARAAQCSALIERVARDALGELGRLVGPRGPHDLAPSGDPDLTATPPSLARVDALTERVRDGGLPVVLRVEGEPVSLPAGVDLAAYRIVQEALANTSKHAGAARAWVVVRYDERAVEVEIADDGRGCARAEPVRNGFVGHGLIGIRERVALYGGTLDVGSRPAGGFRVHARLPIGGA